MNKKVLFLFSIILLFILTIIPNIIGTCDDGQIDINEASLEELDELSGIGLVKAQAIIDTRPFQSIDNLIDVVGIGEVTLSNIKQQGLACVEDEEEQETQKEEESEEEIEKDEKIVEKEIEETSINENNDIEKEEVNTIILAPITPKSIKTENNKEQLDKNKLAIYGLILLCISLVFLFVFRKRKNEKSEFR